MVVRKMSGRVHPRVSMTQSMETQNDELPKVSKIFKFYYKTLGSFSNDGEAYFDQIFKLINRGSDRLII